MVNSRQNRADICQSTYQSEGQRKVVASITDGSKYIASECIWAGISCEIYAGEFVAIIGENGAGKSTFLHCLMGLLPLSGGQRFCVSNKAMLSQLMPELPIIPITARELLGYVVRGKRLWVKRKDTAKRVEEFLSWTNIVSFADKPISQLSGGQWQRVRIAACMIGGPQLLSCDEPLRGLDPVHQDTVMNNLHTWQQKAGIAVVTVGHIHAHLLPKADRIFLLQNSRLHQLTPDEVAQLS